MGQQRTHAAQRDTGVLSDPGSQARPTAIGSLNQCLNDLTGVLGKVRPRETSVRVTILAWISTDRNWPNAEARWSVADEAERITEPPGNRDWFVEDSGGEDDGEMGAAMEAHPDFA